MDNVAGDSLVVCWAVSLLVLFLSVTIEVEMEVFHMNFRINPEVVKLSNEAVAVINESN